MEAQRPQDEPTANLSFKTADILQPDEGQSSSPSSTTGSIVSKALNFVEDDPEALAALA